MNILLYTYYMNIKSNQKENKLSVIRYFVVLSMIHGVQGFERLIIHSGMETKG